MIKMKLSVGHMMRWLVSKENRRQQEKRQTKYEVDLLHKEAIGTSLQKRSSAVEEKTLWPSSIDRVARTWS